MKFMLEASYDADDTWECEYHETIEEVSAAMKKEMLSDPISMPVPDLAGSPI